MFMESTFKYRYVFEKLPKVIQDITVERKLLIALEIGRLSAVI